jgi:hypothetical protein
LLITASSDSELDWASTSNDKETGLLKKAKGSNIVKKVLQSQKATAS